MTNEPIQIMFQNNLTGDMWDLAPVTKSFKLSSKRRGTPAKLELELLHDMAFPEGSRIAIRTASHKMFYGMLFNEKRRKNKNRTLIFFDQKKYLLRKETYVLRNRTLADVVTTIAKDFELQTGKLVAPNVKLPVLLKEEKNALDIIEECIDDILVQTGELTVFWDDFGELRLDFPKNMSLLTILGENSIITDYEFEKSIEDSANIVKLLHENRDSGQRTLYHFKDSENIGLWGKLQHFQVVDENANDAQIREMGRMLMSLKNKPKETVKLSFSVGDFEFRSGRAVYVDLAEIKLKGWYLLDSVTHNVTGASHTMEIELWMGGDGAV